MTTTTSALFLRDPIPQDTSHTMTKSQSLKLNNLTQESTTSSSSTSTDTTPIIVEPDFVTPDNLLLFVPNVLYIQEILKRRIENPLHQVVMVGSENLKRLKSAHDHAARAPMEAERNRKKIIDENLTTFQNVYHTKMNAIRMRQLEFAPSDVDELQNSWSKK
ncbi:hypothetical protein RhiirB3_453098 [Rhizophagus irregularis]|nr:hypothetical protein RhiirB3_453098 [Rhizophagus irregularis]